MILTVTPTMNKAGSWHAAAVLYLFVVVFTLYSYTQQFVKLLLHAAAAASDAKVNEPRGLSMIVSYPGGPVVRLVLRVLVKVRTVNSTRIAHNKYFTAS